MTAYTPLTEQQQSLSGIQLLPSGEALFADSSQKPQNEYGINYIYASDTLELVYKDKFEVKNKCEQSIHKPLGMWG